MNYSEHSLPHAGAGKAATGFQPAIALEGLLSRSGESDTASPGDSERLQMIDNTCLIQEALDRTSARGGGSVVVPPGVFWIRTLSIPASTDLHLAAGSRLLAWPYTEDYEPRTRVQEEETSHRAGDSVVGLSLIVSSNTDRISLTGSGTIDGNGVAFWEIPPREYVRLGGKRSDLNLPKHWEENSPFWRAKKTRLIPLIELDTCRDVVIRDITIANSPGWTLHPLCCDRVMIEGVTIANHMYGPNTDGIDINGCRDVTVRGCFITCGDDAIIVKATEQARSCERISVSDCVLETHCAAFGIGAEVAFPIRDVTVTGISVKRALRMVQIELWDPGLVENVVISAMTGATMTDIPLERPVYVDIQHHGRTDGRLGAVRNVQIRGLSAITRGRCLFTAADGSSIERLVLSGIQLTYPEIEDPEVSVTSSRSSQMSNDSPHTRAARSAFVFDNVNDALIRDVQIQWPNADASDPAGALRGSYDWGELSSDTRKQEALATEPPMNAFLFRRSSKVAIDAPFVEGNRASLCRLVGENGTIVVNGDVISDRVESSFGSNG